MTNAEKAMQIIEQIAADDQHHGYEWGGWGPNYDCGHLIIAAFGQAGIPVKSCGATYTGNMRPAMLQCGFSDVTAIVNLQTGAGLRRCDVLINETHHAAIYAGGGRVIQARSNFDGRPGDSSGKEICSGPYYNYPWDCVMRPPAEDAPPEQSAGTGTNAELIVDEPKQPETPTAQAVTITLPTVKYGDKGMFVKILQTALMERGYPCGWMGADGEFGQKTKKALIRFQDEHRLTTDGICGTKTWKALLS